MTLLDQSEDQQTDTQQSRDQRAAAGRVQTVSRGLRIRGVRLASVAKTAFVFFAVGYVATLLALVVLWNIMRWVGFIGNVEDILTTSLGLERVTISGGDLLGLTVVGLGIVAVFGFVFTVLAAMIYNATGKIFGGLLVDTTLTRRRRLRRPARRRDSR